MVSELPRGRRVVAPRTVLLIASAGVFMAFLDNTIVSIAFPDMLRSFPDAGLADLSWVFNIYSVVLGALLVPAGRLADLLGRRRVFLVGTLVFTVASLLCAIAPSVAALLAARALQAAGAATIVPASLALILNAYPEAQRGQAVAVWSATGALAAGIGPSIGGLLVDLADWRMVFLINLPLGAAVWRLGATRLVESRAPGRRMFPDLAGAGLLALSIGLLSVAIVQGDSWGWLAVPTVVAALAAIATGVLFGRRCRQHRAPIVDLELLRSRSFVVTGVLTLVGGAGFFALGLANVLYLMNVWGYSALVAGLAGTPAPFLAAAAAIVAGRFITGRDPRPLLVVGSLIWAAGPLLLIAGFSPTPEYLTAYLPPRRSSRSGSASRFRSSARSRSPAPPAAASRRRPRSTAPSARSEPRSASPSSWRSSATRRPPRPRRPSSVPGCSPPAASCWSHSARWRWVGCGRRNGGRPGGQPVGAGPRRGGRRRRGAAREAHAARAGASSAGHRSLAGGRRSARGGAALPGADAGAALGGRRPGRARHGDRGKLALSPGRRRRRALRRAQRTLGGRRRDAGAATGCRSRAARRSRAGRARSRL